MLLCQGCILLFIISTIVKCRADRIYDLTVHISLAIANFFIIYSTMFIVQQKQDPILQLKSGPLNPKISVFHHCHVAMQSLKKKTKQVVIITIKIEHEIR
jgi:hypothetical protein